MQGTPCQARSDDKTNPLRETPHPDLPQSGEGAQSYPSAGDSVSNLDYSGGRKTHRFPPPNGLGSLSLTHRHTENPTGVTHFLFVIPGCAPESHSWTDCEGRNNLKPSKLEGDTGSSPV